MKRSFFVFLSILSLLMLSALAGCSQGGETETDAGPDGALDGAADGQADGGDAGGETDNRPLVFQRNPSNPVYQSSGSDWNFAGIGDPCVLYDSDSGIYKMWTSAGGVVPPDTDVIVRTQYLTSADGITWTEHGNPVLMEGDGALDWDRGGVETVSVLEDGGQYWLWYAGYQRREEPPLSMKIGVATSPDGVNWEKAAENPVIDSGSAGEWDESFVESPSVVKLSGTFYMWYTGVDSQSRYRIGLATSEDGIHWIKNPANPVFSPDASNEWENAVVYAPAVIRDIDQFVMFYVGLNAGTFLNAMRIGMATSTDGVSWTRPQSVPVLDVGAAAAWDEQGAFVPTVVMRADRYEMWYLSGKNPNEKIGLATCIK
jgi:predicted GH43/DUF377 family glycosyl hydrolase